MQDQPQRLSTGALLIVATMLSGCSSDGGAAGGSVGIPGRLDGGPLLDAGARHDGGSVEAPADAAPASTVDAAAVLGECSGETLSVRVAAADGPTFGVALEGNRVHLAYVVPSCGSSYARPTSQALDYLTFDTTGAPGDVVHLGREPADDCALVRFPALALGSAGPVLYYSSDASRDQAGEPSFSFELFARTLGASDPPRQLTRSDQVEVLAAAARFAAGEGPWLAYAQQPGVRRGESAPIYITRPGGESPTLVAGSEAHRPVTLALSPLGGSSGAAGAVAWVSDAPDATGIYLQTLASDGRALEAPRLLSAQVGSASSVRLAARAQGGAAIFSELRAGAHELQFVALDELGTLAAPVSLTRGNEDVLEAAIAPYANGYVVAYRRGPRAGVTSSSIRLLFIDDEGRLGGTRFVAEAGLLLGLDVLVATDGRLVLLWNDAVANATEPEELELFTRVARLSCL